MKTSHHCSHVQCMFRPKLGHLHLFHPCVNIVDYVCGLKVTLKEKNIHDDQKVSVNLMITIQNVTSNVQSVPRQSPDIY
jgi:hypothetical protein